MSTYTTNYTHNMLPTVLWFVVLNDYWVDFTPTLQRISLTLGQSTEHRKTVRIYDLHRICNDKFWYTTQIARSMGPKWGPSGADRTQVGPMLAPWNLLSGYKNVWATTAPMTGHIYTSIWPKMVVGSDPGITCEKPLSTPVSYWRIMVSALDKIRATFWL